MNHKEKRLLTFCVGMSVGLLILLPLLLRTGFAFVELYDVTNERIKRLEAQVSALSKANR